MISLLWLVADRRYIFTRFSEEKSEDSPSINHKSVETKSFDGVTYP